MKVPVVLRGVHAGHNGGVGGNTPVRGAGAYWGVVHGGGGEGGGGRGGGGGGGDKPTQFWIARISCG